jgi:hypothetical protein
MAEYARESGETRFHVSSQQRFFEQLFKEG